MRKRLKRKKIQAMLLSVLTGVVVAIALFLLQEWQPIPKIGEHVVLYATFSISIGALVFSIRTFYSIDTVDKITSMEGNVLENECYSIAYHEAVKMYPHTDCKMFTQALLKNMTPSFIEGSCMEYADQIQKIIDNLLWFAWSSDDEETKNRKDKIIEELENVYMGEFQDLSSNITYLLRENLKLIKGVLQYQQNVKENNYHISELEDIREGILRNPISRTLYYNYLGLDYRRKAKEILDKCNHKGDEFSAEHMIAIQKYRYTMEEKQQLYILIDRAKLCFEKATEIARDNILWRGFIEYNKVRVEIMRYLLKSACEKQIDEKRKIEEIIDYVVKTRETVEYLFSLYDSGEDAEPYLNKKFKEETQIAKRLEFEFRKI